MKKPLALSIPIFFLAAAGHAADMPFMKDGFWSTHTVTTTQPGNKKEESNRSICRNRAYEEHVRELSKKAAEKCKTISENKSGGTTTTEMECSVAGTVIRSKGTVTIASENGAHSEVLSTYTPPMGGMSGMTMIMDQKYLGACPAGVEPGDMIAADGKKISSWKR